MAKGKGFMAEFKKFIMRGNVIDLAVGVIVGGAFQAIVKSLVDDVVMPVISLATKGINFADLFIALDGQVTIAPAMYFKNGGKKFEVTISDSSVAAYAAEGSKLVFFGEKEGQTSAVIKSDSGESFTFTITVRKSAASNGWL